jgi:hypothetical protein
MRLPKDAQAWVEARRRHRFTHAQVQMARELGLNPAKLGKLDNHQKEPWKAPLPQYIEQLYEAVRAGRAKERHMGRLRCGLRREPAKRVDIPQLDLDCPARHGIEVGQFLQGDFG